MQKEIAIIYWRTKERWANKQRPKMEQNVPEL